jgi:hypothetical protein
VKRLLLIALGLVAAVAAVANADEAPPAPTPPAAAATSTPAAMAATGHEAEVNAVVDPTAERMDSELNKLQFYAGVVGGMHVETLQLRDSDQSEDRLTTVALSRFGLRGRLSGGIYIESEFEVNGGPHGTSVWEGQAALQVRNQLIRLERDRFRVEAGRITDDSSLDYYSVHTADQLLTDGYTRSSILASGFNRGQGVLARYEIAPGLKPGITLNAANPTSTTASLVIGGTFPPFSRFYLVPHQQVGRDAASLPADTYHILIATPSITFDSDLVEAQTAVQAFQVNTDTSSTEDENIVGYNVRAGAKLKLLDSRLTPFVNASRVTNSIVEPDDGNVLAEYAYVGYTASGGLDLNIAGRNGIGASYAFIRGQQGDQSRTTEHVVNVGGTYWVSPTTSVGARAAMYRVCAETPDEGCVKEGARSMFVTMRTVL